MKNFAQLLDKLYFTYSHLAKTELLNDFFRNTPDPDRGYALAVIANTLSFPNIKRGLIKEIVHTRVDPKLFDLSYDYVGDLSETVALLWPENQLSDDRVEMPSLTEIIHTFKTLSKEAAGLYLSELLNQSSAIERWTLLKLVTGNMRVGVSARFLKQALSKFGKVDIHAIEKVWHALSPPYTELFAWLEGKTQAPNIEDSVYFHPVMLSHPLEEKELTILNTEEFSIERKYDGIRVQVVSVPAGVALYTRSGDDISHSFPDILETVHTPVVLDGELVIKKNEEILSFNQLQQRLNRKNPSKKIRLDSPAAIILYDILRADEKDLRHLSFIERRAALEQWYAIHKPANMLLSDILIHEAGLLELKKTVMGEKHVAVEGLMLKRNNSPYIAGRPIGHWYKWKREPLLIDAVLMYAQRGHGKRSSFYSDFTFGVWQEEQLLPIGKAYFGFTDTELKALDQWIRQHTIHRFGPVREVEKALVFEVAFDAANYSSRHKSGIALRFPRIHRIRWDKPALEADTLDNVKKLMTV